VYICCCNLDAYVSCEIYTSASDKRHSSCHLDAYVSCEFGDDMKQNAINCCNLDAYVSCEYEICIRPLQSPAATWMLMYHLKMEIYSLDGIPDNFVI